MSQVTSPTTTLRSQVRDHRTVAVSALLALLATVAVVLVLAIDGGSSNTSSVAQRSQAALRSDGGPEESAVAGSLQAPKTAETPAANAYAIGIPSPSAAARAAAGGIEGLTTWDGRPDESRTAAAIAGN
jgi:hypothetical protein